MAPFTPPSVAAAATVLQSQSNIEKNALASHLLVFVDVIGEFLNGINLTILNSFDVADVENDVWANNPLARDAQRRAKLVNILKGESQKQRKVNQALKAARIRTVCHRARRSPIRLRMRIRHRGQWIRMRSWVLRRSV